MQTGADLSNESQEHAIVADSSPTKARRPSGHVHAASYRRDFGGDPPSSHDESIEGTLHENRTHTEGQDNLGTPSPKPNSEATHTVGTSLAQAEHRAPGEHGAVASAAGGRHIITGDHPRHGRADRRSENIQNGSGPIPTPLHQPSASRPPFTVPNTAGRDIYHSEGTSNKLFDQTQGTAANLRSIRSGNSRGMIDKRFVRADEQKSPGALPEKMLPALFKPTAANPMDRYFQELLRQPQLMADAPPDYRLMAMRYRISELEEHQRLQVRQSRQTYSHIKEADQDKRRTQIEKHFMSVETAHEPTRPGDNVTTRNADLFHRQKKLEVTLSGGRCGFVGKYQRAAAHQY